MDTIRGPGNVFVNINQSHRPTDAGELSPKPSDGEAAPARQGATLQGGSVVFESAKPSSFQDLLGSGAPSLPAGGSTGPGTTTVGDLICGVPAALSGSADMASGAAGTAPGSANGQRGDLATFMEGSAVGTLGTGSPLGNMKGNPVIGNRQGSAGNSGLRGYVPQNSPGQTGGGGSANAAPGGRTSMSDLPYLREGSSGEESGGISDYGPTGAFGGGEAFSGVGSYASHEVSIELPNSPSAEASGSGDPVPQEIDDEDPPGSDSNEQGPQTPSGGGGGGGVWSAVKDAATGNLTVGDYKGGVAPSTSTDNKYDGDPAGNAAREQGYQGSLVDMGGRYGKDGKVKGEGGETGGAFPSGSDAFGNQPGLGPLAPNIGGDSFPDSSSGGEDEFQFELSTSPELQYGDAGTVPWSGDSPAPSTEGGGSTGGTDGTSGTEGSSGGDDDETVDATSSEEPPEPPEGEGDSIDGDGRSGAPPGYFLPGGPGNPHGGVVVGSGSGGGEPDLDRENPQYVLGGSGTGSSGGSQETNPESDTGHMEKTAGGGGSTRDPEDLPEHIAKIAGQANLGAALKNTGK